MTKERGSSKDRNISAPKREGGSISRRDLAGHAVAAMAVGASMLGSKASAQTTLRPSPPGVRPQQQGPALRPGGRTASTVEIRIPRNLALSDEQLNRLSNDFKNDLVEIIRRDTGGAQIAPKVTQQEVTQTKVVYEE